MNYPTIKIKHLFSFVLCTVLLLSLFSCQKKDNTLIDPSQVVITIASPTQNQIYHTGDTVLINADILYPTELHGYEVKIIDTVSGLTLYDDDQDIHNNHLTVQDKWVDTATQKKNLKLEIIALIDHTGHEATKQINIQSQP